MLSKTFDQAVAAPQDVAIDVREPDAPPVPRDAQVKEEASHPEDNVRLYLSEIGTVPLLDKAGEVGLAKQMERGEARMRKVLSRSSWLWQELLDLRGRLKASPQIGRQLIEGAAGADSGPGLASARRAR